MKQLKTYRLSFAGKDRSTAHTTTSDTGVAGVGTRLAAHHEESTRMWVSVSGISPDGRFNNGLLT